MKLIFTRHRHILTVLPASQFLRTSQWPAYNNTDSRSKGKWPLDEFQAVALIEVTGPSGKDDGKFGPYFLKFLVAGRSGLGIHSGREGIECGDGLGRKGPEWATMGCIRTTSAAMHCIAAAWALDEAATLTVEEG